MKLRTALFAAAMLFAGTALAFHCPQDMKKIDEALAKKGKHKESLEALNRAEKTLGIPTN
jgi:hypothetical protein